MTATDLCSSWGDDEQRALQLHVKGVSEEARLTAWAGGGWCLAGKICCCFVAKHHNDLVVAGWIITSPGVWWWVW